MRIENIKLNNFRVFSDLHLTKLPKLAFFVGANGSGKTTLFKLFAFLKDALKNNVYTALQREGGFNEWITRGQAQQAITIEIQFRLEISGKERLVTYYLEITKAADKPIIQREILRYKRGQHGSPYHFLDFSCGQGYAITNEEDFSKTDEALEREQQSLASPDILAIKGIGQFQRFKAANAFRSLIEDWHVSDFHITAARQRVESGVATHLSETGDNLPLVAKQMYSEHPDIFRYVLEKMQQRVPGISSVSAEETIDGHVVLRFQDEAYQQPFIARNVSDGTIKMFAYLLLLHDPSPHPFLCIEEPENQLYPALLGQLVEELRDYARKGGQVFVSTHSPDLLDAARLEEVFWLEKNQGKTQIYKVADDVQISRLNAAGDPLGALWNQGFFSTQRIVHL